MTQRPTFTATHAIVVVVLVFFAIATPMALRADDRLDRARPMYDDRDEMVWLQYQSVVKTGRAVPGTASSKNPMVVADKKFYPATGVVVDVSADNAPCVRARNDEGDVTDWTCVDRTSPPADPNPEPVDPIAG